MRVVDVLLQVVDDVVRRVQDVGEPGAAQEAVGAADLVEADEEDVATDPEHGQRCRSARWPSAAWAWRPTSACADLLGDSEDFWVRWTPTSSIFTRAPRSRRRATVMMTATTPRRIARVQKLASGSESTTSLSAITMISADRMKSVRIAPATVFASCSGVNSPCVASSSSASGCVAADLLPDLVRALVGEEATAEDEDHGQQLREELSQQDRRREDEEQLVAQRADRDLLDDRQLALGRGAVEVLRGDGGVVDDHAGGLGARPAGRGTDVVDGRSGDAGQRGDVVEQGEESCGHQAVSLMSFTGAAYPRGGRPLHAPRAAGRNPGRPRGRGAVLRQPWRPSANSTPPCGSMLASSTLSSSSVAAPASR